MTRRVKQTQLKCLLALMDECYGIARRLNLKTISGSKISDLIAAVLDELESFGLNYSPRGDSRK